MESEEELLNEFITEGKEHLEKIEGMLLHLEKTGKDSDDEIVATVFRSIHSIKGAAGFLGLNTVNQLSHQMETVLSMVRAKELVPNPACIDSLLVGVDLLNAMLDDITNSESINVEDICGKLGKLIDGNLSPQSRQELTKTAVLTEVDGQSGEVIAESDFNITEFDLSHRTPGYDHFYRLRYDLQEMAQQKLSPLALIDRLLETGEVMAGKIACSTHDLRKGPPAGPVYYDIVYATVLADDLMPQVSGLPVKRIFSLTMPSEYLPAEPSDAFEEDAIKNMDPELEEFTTSEMDKQDAAQSPSSTAPQSAAKGNDTIRINIDILDKLMNLAGELVLVRNQQLMSIERNEGQSLRAIVQRLDLVTSELQETIMRTRMQPIGNLFNKFPRVIRDLGGKLGKKIRLDISGSEVELDKTILESLADPLTHIVRNCCDHAIETPQKRTAAGKDPVGVVKLQAFHESGQINIVVADDGQGISPEKVKQKAIENNLRSAEEISRMSDKEILNLIFLPGFSTAQKVTDISGRGVGMDVVKTSVERLGGVIDLESEPGKGATLRLRLPLTLAIIPCLIVASGDHRYAIPQINLEELVRLYDDELWRSIDCVGSQEVYRLRNHLLPMARLREILDSPEAFTPEVQVQIAEKYRQQRAVAKVNFENGERGSDALFFAVVKVGASRMGLIVDEVLGTEEIVVKPMHPRLKGLDCYAGATVMGDGRVALILNIEGVAAHAGITVGSDEQEIAAEREGHSLQGDMQNILVFRSGCKEHFAVALPLIRRLEHIKLSDVEIVGDREFVTIDGVSTRIFRLDKQLNVSPCVEQEEMYLLLPKHAPYPVGVLVSSIEDIVLSEIDLDIDTCQEDGILGTAIVQDNMTIFPDLYRLFDLQRKASGESSAVKRHAKAKILLLEDMSFFRQLVSGYLQQMGHEVVQAVDGQEGLLKLQSGENYDLIISDLEMPRVNGWEFIQKVRALGNETPAVALSSLDDPVSRQKALEAGFDHFELKFEREQFTAAVARMLTKVAVVSE